MPNWVANTLIVRESDYKRLEQFVAEDGAGHEKFLDFNKIIPIPDTVWTGGGVGFGPDWHPDDMTLKEYRAKYPDGNWYDWQTNHWGTKWNSTNLRMAMLEDQVGECSFDTAWAPPDPVMAKLYEMGIEFIHYYFDEGHCFWGSIPYTEDGTYPYNIGEVGRDEDYKQKIYKVCYGVDLYEHLIDNGREFYWELNGDLEYLLAELAEKSKLEIDPRRRTETTPLKGVLADLKKLVAAALDPNTPCYESNESINAFKGKLTSLFSTVRYTQFTPQELKILTREVTHASEMIHQAYARTVLDNLDVNNYLKRVINAGLQEMTSDFSQVVKVEGEVTHQLFIDNPNYFWAALYGMVCRGELGLENVARELVIQFKVGNDIPYRHRTFQSNSYVSLLYAVCRTISHHNSSTQLPPDPLGVLINLLVSIGYVSMIYQREFIVPQDTFDNAHQLAAYIETIKQMQLIKLRELGCPRLPVDSKLSNHIERVLGMGWMM